MEDYNDYNGNDVVAWATVNLYPTLNVTDNKAAVFESASEGARVLRFTDNGGSGYSQDEEEVNLTVFVNPAATYTVGTTTYTGFKGYYRIALEYIMNHLAVNYGCGIGSGYTPYSEGYIDAIPNPIPQGVPFSDVELSASEADNIFNAVVTFKNPSDNSVSQGGTGASDPETKTAARNARNANGASQKKKESYTKTPQVGVIKDFAWTSQGGTVPVKYAVKNAYTSPTTDSSWFNYTSPSSPTRIEGTPSNYRDIKSISNEMNYEYDIIDRTSEFTITVYYDVFSDVDLELLYRATGCTNSETFLWYPARCVLFKGADVTSVNTDNKEFGDNEAVSFKVTYHFAVSPQKSITVLEPFAVKYQDITNAVIYPGVMYVYPGWDIAEKITTECDADMRGRANIFGNDTIKGTRTYEKLWYGDSNIVIETGHTEPSGPAESFDSSTTERITEIDCVAIRQVYDTFNFNTFNFEVYDVITPFSSDAYTARDGRIVKEIH